MRIHSTEVLFSLVVESEGRVYQAALNSREFGDLEAVFWPKTLPLAVLCYNLKLRG